MTCKYLYADWCHKDPTKEEIESGYTHQEKCHWYCYGKVEDCPDYIEKQKVK